MKIAEEVTGEVIHESHAKSVLIGIIDPLTRQHTAMHQGGKTSYEDFKKIVLEFANNTAGPDAMQIGRVGEGQCQHPIVKEE